MLRPIARAGQPHAVCFTSLHGASGTEGARSAGTVVCMESASKQGATSTAGNRRFIDWACESHSEFERDGPITIAVRPEGHAPGSRTSGILAGITIMNH